MSALSNFLHPGRAYRKAQQEMNNYYQQGQNALSPYMQQGQQAFEPMMNAMQSLLNPADLYNQWASGYETSPYAQDLMGRATSEGLDAASSMGLLGSTPALQALQAGRTQIFNQDRNNYLDNLMQKYMTGAQMAQNLYGSGQNAANQFGQNAMNMGQNSASLTYGANSAGGNMMGGLLGMALGGALGGPLGAMAGSSLGGGGGWNTRA